jgi:hypothetical protein
MRAAIATSKADGNRVTVEGYPQLSHSNQKIVRDRFSQQSRRAMTRRPLSIHLCCSGPKAGGGMRLFEALS